MRPGLFHIIFAILRYTNVYLTYMSIREVHVSQSFYILVSLRFYTLYGAAT